MKRVITLLLALMMVFSLVACGGEGGKDNAEPSVESALKLMENIWAGYGDADKFPVMGGDINTGIMDAPGTYSLEDASMVDYSLVMPEANVEMLSEAASIIHMMNANTFTAAAFRVADAKNTEAVIEAYENAIDNRQWMCGFPEKLVIMTLDNDYVVTVFGAGDLISVFVEKAQAAFEGIEIKVDKALA